MAVVAACGDAGPDRAGSSVAPAPNTTASATPLPAADTERAVPAEDAPVGELVAGWNDAGFDLLRRLPTGDNVVFSPASIGHALLMAAAAADEPTRAAIESAFALPADAHAAWNSIDQAIAASQSERVSVAIADRIWPRVGVTPAQEWVDLLATHHGADVIPLDFAGDPQASRRTINDWVGEQTAGLIPELLPDGFIQGNTVLVLTDAIYFAADWEKTFGKYGTVAGSFTTADGAEVDVSFMRELELTDRRGRGDGFVGAEIPYLGDDYSMLVLVPDAGTYEDFVGRLDQGLLDSVDATFTAGPYELLLPKWDDSYQIDLLAWLTDLGAAPGAYPSISADAFLGAGVHAADIAVDEYGTVAAAATGLAFAESGPPEPELTVAADRPFVYLIRHRPSGLVLFAGHVTDPR
ncbi:MAG TPA: serpin family protein [Ilumatobacter sp.]|nr:serpin family protein [Ilumatobacter sp.]